MSATAARLSTRGQPTATSRDPATLSPLIPAQAGTQSHKRQDGRLVVREWGMERHPIRRMAEILRP